MSAPHIQPDPAGTGHGRSVPASRAAEPPGKGTRHDGLAPPRPGAGSFRDTVAAEWLKLSTVRSTYAFLAAGGAATLFGLLVLFFLIRAYDRATPVERANFETADVTVLVMPFVEFFVGAIGAMLITTEFTTGTIGPVLLAVPRRRVLLAAKATVAGTTGLLGGLLLALLAVVGATVLLGDRPAPLSPWPAWTDALPTVCWAALVVLVTGVVAVGLGAVLRSTASTLLTLGGLVLVAPSLVFFLPATWRPGVGAVLLPNLTSQLAGGDHGYPLSPAGAAAVLVGYVVVALGAGAFSLGRRDVS